MSDKNGCKTTSYIAFNNTCKSRCLRALQE